jgi:hypothetical protein
MVSDDNLGTAFSIRCRDGKRYKIEFSKNHPVRLIRIPPGICQLDDIIYRGVAGSASDMASLRLLGNEHLQPGGVYYVGDFVVAAKAVYSGGAPVFGGRVRQSWALFSPRNNYASTTAELKQRFPGFSAVATEDRMPRQ